MSSGKDLSPRVNDFYHDTREELELCPVFKQIGLTNSIFPDASSPVKYNLQVWGRTEASYFKKLSPTKKKEYLRSLVSPDTAAVIIATGMAIPVELQAKAKKHRIGLFTSPYSKKKCVETARKHLSRYFPKQIVMAGGLLKIYGLGVLIIGDSGVGKSESALELITRGYRFVSDDATQISRTVDNRLIGKAPPMTRNFMEIRGLSIINIKHIFGSHAICQQTEINLVINLEKWDTEKKYDRLGLESPQKKDILGVSIPQITIPVGPGRNISTLIEVACKIHLLRKKGYHAPREIAKRLDRALSIR